MCGICGQLNLTLEPLEHPESIDRMSARLEHRGPDSHGKYELPYLALGIRRLSIIDLATGDQPLSNESGEVTLVFNGEIYNYRELRERLLDHGHQFRTKSDGEVIAHLYEELGPDCVNELNGMFAIALWDARRNRLLLARDRAGEKPLYYWHRGSALAFSSEIKSLFEYPGIDRSLDREAVTQYFLYGYFPSPRSIFADVRKLPGGHRMIVENSEIRIEPYWQLEKFVFAHEPEKRPKLDEKKLLEDLRNRLREAAVSRLVSDVPLGVFLSGGVDSSTLVALMSELTPGNVNTFSVSFREKSFDEEPYAKLVAKKFKTRHHALEVGDADMREALEFLGGHLDEPVADPAVIPTYLMSRFARKEIKVALSGEGSDEIFGGYPTYLGARLAGKFLRLPKFLRQVVGKSARLLPSSPGAVPMGTFIRRFLAYAEREPAERHQIWFGVLAPSEIDQLFVPEWAGDAPPSASVFAPALKLIETARFDSPVSLAQFLDFRLYLEDNLLVKIDRASMATSLELRTPFLDHRLVEFVAGLPSELKVNGLKTKVLLKKAVEPWLPHQIVYRQKRGFSVPIAQWLREGLRPIVEELLGHERIEKQGIFNPQFVSRLIHEHSAGRADHRKALWALLCFQMWHDRWAS